MRYLETDLLEPLDAPLAQKLLWLADFFKIEELQQQCIDIVIIPSLSIDTVFLFLKDAQRKLQAIKRLNDLWYRLFTACIDFAASNIHLIMKEKPSELLSRSQFVVEEIVERAMRIAVQSDFTNTEQLEYAVKALKQLRATDSLTALLFAEKRRKAAVPS